MYNLAGGIFKWINEGYSVYNHENHVTNVCHPYNRIWGKFLYKQFHPLDS